MPDNFTPTLNIRVPDLQTLNWDVPLNENWNLISLVLVALLRKSRVHSGLDPSSVGFTLNYAAGSCEVAGSPFSVTASGVTINPDSVEFVYVDDTGTVQKSASHPTGNFVPIAMAFLKPV